MFNSSMPDTPVRGDWPPAAAKPQEPGEFTRMFQAPSPPRPQAAPAKPTGGEFSQLFKASSGAMPAGPQFLRRPSFPQTAPRANSASSTPGTGRIHAHVRSGVAGRRRSTCACAIERTANSYGRGQRYPGVPRSPGAPPAASPQGPSEYTRLISVSRQPRCTAARGASFRGASRRTGVRHAATGNAESLAAAAASEAADACRRTARDAEDGGPQGACSSGGQRPLQSHRICC
jgi:hypothetical protein